MVVLDICALEPGRRGVLLVAVRVNIGDLDRGDVRVVYDDVLQRGVRGLRLTQRGARERDAGLAFPADRLLLEFREPSA